MKIKLLWKILATTITSLILLLVIVTPVAGEEPFDNAEYYCCQNNMSNWYGVKNGHRRNYYDLKNIETLNGKVVRIDTHRHHRKSFAAVHLLVDTGKEQVEVHLAPSWYLEEQNFKIAPEDKITITGSKINPNGETEIIASQITKGNTTLRLRDQQGFPVWRGDK